MANAHTPHSIKLRQDTAKAWTKDRVRKGGCRLSLVLDADAKVKLDRLTQHYGSKTAALVAALDFADQALTLAQKLRILGDIGDPPEPPPA